MLITVYAHPNSKVPRISERDPGIFDIYVSASAQDGKANQSILKELAGYFRGRSEFADIKTRRYQ